MFSFEPQQERKLVIAKVTVTVINTVAQNHSDITTVIAVLIVIVIVIIKFRDIKSCSHNFSCSSRGIIFEFESTVIDSEFESTVIGSEKPHWGEISKVLCCIVLCFIFLCCIVIAGCYCFF